MANSLKGKNAVVTGSTSGIGLGIAKALAAQGANTVLNGFGDVEGPKAEIAALGVQVTYHGADMSKPAEIEAMIEHAKATFGSYCEAYTRPKHTNSQEERTTSCICLGPTNFLTFTLGK